jgi:hypothetical protein
VVSDVSLFARVEKVDVVGRGVDHIEIDGQASPLPSDMMDIWQGLGLSQLHHVVVEFIPVAIDESVWSVAPVL